MVLAPLVKNMKPLLLEQRSWTFSALRVSNCILRKANAHLKGIESAVEIPRHDAHASKLWLMIARCDGWTGLRLSTHGSQPLLPRQQLALLPFGQPDVGNVCTSVEQLSVVCHSSQCQ